METPTSTIEGGPPSQLSDRRAEEDFCRSLPRQDPIAAQKLLCDAIARLDASREPVEQRLSALLVFDKHAGPISRRLLVLYGEGDAQLRMLDRRFFIAASRLSRSFAESYERFKGDIESSTDSPWRKRAGMILVQQFRHRQVELLLRLFRYKKRNSEQWQQFHATYQFARARGLAREPLPRGFADDKSAPEQTLEQQFIEVLLLGAMSNGQFSPRELLLASGWIARWRSLLTLQSATEGGDRRMQGGFVVDLCGTEGLKRFSSEEAGDLLHLDTSPLMGAIDKEVVALGGAPTGSNMTAANGHDARGALLSKLRILLAPGLVQIKRRGDRKPVAYSVQVISGLPQIVQILRKETQTRAEQLERSAAQVAEITISASSGHTRISTSVVGAAGLASFSIATTFGTRPQVWQVKDCSDSGCRMRGQTADLNGLIPGSLVAIREGENSLWTVAVIRRLRRLMVDHLEVSVEHIGRRPRFVKMVTDGLQVASIDDVPVDDALNSKRKCFGALYLPASEKHPTMPIQTLLVPASVFNAGGTVILLSSSATYRLRLNKPLEQQSDFVWTSFAVIDKAVAQSQRMRDARVVA